MSNESRSTERRRPASIRRTPFIIGAMALVVWACSTPGGAPSSRPSTAAATVAPTISSPSTTSPATPPPSGTIRIYTSVTQGTVDAVVAGYKATDPGVTVEVFRAPTGERAARIAAELRNGPIRGDILWLTDPLSIQAYAGQHLLRAWEPSQAVGIDKAFRGETYWGTRFVNMVMVRGKGVAFGPASWMDLTDPAYKDAVAIPDPGYAGSALGALGYFALSSSAGLDFYASLKANGAVQVKTPDEVTAGVAEGRFKVGMTLDQSARTAIKKGSPIELVWPTDGAIAIYSPIGVVDATENTAPAESFVEFVLSEPGQKAIAGTGFQPIRPGAGGPAAEGSQVYPDWMAAFGRQEELLAAYRAIFGG